MYEDLIGCKFKIHGRTTEEGFDCYGLAIEVLRRNGITLKDVFYDETMYYQTSEQLKKTIPNIKLKYPEKLCIILINVKGRPTHIGVYIGDGMFIHSTDNMGVVVEPLHRWNKRIVGYYKVSNS